MTQNVIYFDKYSMCLWKECCFSVVEWNVPKMSVRSNSLMLCSGFYTLLIFCLVVLSITETGMSKSPTVDLSILPFTSRSFAICILKLCSVYEHLRLLCFHELIPLLLGPSLSLVIFLILKSNLSGIDIVLLLSLDCVCIVHLLVSFYC